jgi:hypothetical protein
MSNQPRLFAHPAARILCTKTGATVGFLYQWNTGEQQAAWIDRKVRNVEYEPMHKPTCEPIPSKSLGNVCGQAPSKARF